jgi:hypothetical protein
MHNAGGAERTPDSTPWRARPALATCHPACARPAHTYTHTHTYTHSLSTQPTRPLGRWTPPTPASARHCWSRRSLGSCWAAPSARPALRASTSPTAAWPTRRPSASACWGSWRRPACWAAGCRLFWRARASTPQTRGRRYRWGANAGDLAENGACMRCVHAGGEPPVGADQAADGHDRTRKQASVTQLCSWWTGRDMAGGEGELK